MLNKSHNGNKIRIDNKEKKEAKIID